MDVRYGCLLCPNLPHPGYLDRLRKGRDLGKQKYSLQHHVETYHPDIPDWQNLKVDLPKFKRPGNRKRKRLNLVNDSSESSSSSSNSASSGAPGPSKSTRRVTRATTVAEQEYDSDTIVVSVGTGHANSNKKDSGKGQGNGKSKGKGKGKAVANDDEEEEPEEETDEEMTDAPPLKKDKASEIQPTHAIEVDEGETDEEQTDEEMKDVSGQKQKPVAPQVNPYPSDVPTPDTTAVHPGPPALGPSVRSLIMNTAMAVAPYRRAATMDGLVAQNIALTSSIQNYERVNNSLRTDVRSLSYLATNALEAGLGGHEPTTENVHGWLSIYARDDGAMVERFVGRITNELSRRYDEMNGPRPFEPPRHVMTPLTAAQMMPPPPRPAGLRASLAGNNNEDSGSETDEEL